jgi:flagellar motor component MotA
MIRFLLGTIAAIGGVALAIVIEGGNLLSYFAITAFSIALLVPFFAVLAVWSLKEWGQAWRDAMAPAKAAKETRVTSAAIWAFSEKASYAAGIVGFIAGLILVLSQLRDISTIGPSLAIGLTCPMYTILLGLIYRILKARVDRD